MSRGTSRPPPQRGRTDSERPPHGGQVWPAGAVGMVAKNERNYGRKHITDHCDAIVSGGTGTWGYNFRTRAAQRSSALNHYRKGNEP